MCSVGIGSHENKVTLPVGNTSVLCGLGDMGEATVLVCDTCGRPAVETVSLKAGRLNRQKDACQEHLDALFAGHALPSVAGAASSSRFLQPRSAGAVHLGPRTRPPLGTAVVAPDPSLPSPSGLSSERARRDSGVRFHSRL